MNDIAEIMKAIEKAKSLPDFSVSSLEKAKGSLRELLTSQVEKLREEHGWSANYGTFVGIPEAGRKRAAAEDAARKQLESLYPGCFEASRKASGDALDGVWRLARSEGKEVGTHYWGSQAEFKGTQGYFNSPYIPRGAVAFHLSSTDPQDIRGVEQHRLNSGHMYGPHNIEGSIDAAGLLKMTIDGSTGYYERDCRPYCSWNS
jgi:hypothetical protein